MNLYKNQSSTKISSNAGTDSTNFRIYFRLLTASVPPPPPQNRERTHEYIETHTINTRMFKSRMST